MSYETASVCRPATLTASRGGWSSLEEWSPHKEGATSTAEAKNQTMHCHPQPEWEEVWRAWAGVPTLLCVLSYEPERREGTRRKEGATLEYSTLLNSTSNN